MTEPTKLPPHERMKKLKRELQDIELVIARIENELIKAREKRKLLRFHQSRVQKAIAFANANRSKVVLVLREHGPQMEHEIAEKTGLPVPTIKRLMPEMKVANTAYPAQVHVCERRKVEVNGRFYPRPVYALGPDPNPQADRIEIVPRKTPAKHKPAPLKPIQCPPVTLAADPFNLTGQRR